MSKLFVNKNDLFTPTPRKIRGLKEVGNHVVLKILGYQTCRFDVVFGKKSCRTEKDLLVTLVLTTVTRVIESDGDNLGLLVTT